MKYEKIINNKPLKLIRVMANKFQKAEIAGRELFSKWVALNPKVLNVEFTEDEYDQMDAIITLQNGMRVGIEIKKRDVTSTAYPDFILEEKKRVSLIDRKRTDNLDGVMYCNFFTDDVMVMWRVDSNRIKNIPSTFKSCRKTTAVYGGYIQKEVKLLKLNQAHHIYKF